MVIRPVEPGDLPRLLKLAAETGGGLTSLPVDESDPRGADRPARSRPGAARATEKASRAMSLCWRSREAARWWASLRDPRVAVGLNDPWYNYRVRHQSMPREGLSVYQALPTLFLA